MANNPIVNMFKVKELRERILFTFIVLAVYRFGSVLTIPGINAQALTAYFESLTKGNAFVDYMDFFAGGAFSNFSVFMLGVMPYISTQIIAAGLNHLPVIEKNSTGRRRSEKSSIMDTNWNCVCLFNSVTCCLCICPEYSKCNHN